MVRQNWTLSWPGSLSYRQLSSLKGCEEKTSRGTLGQRQSFDSPPLQCSVSTDRKILFNKRHKELCFVTDIVAMKTYRQDKRSYFRSAPKHVIFPQLLSISEAVFTLSVFSSQLGLPNFNCLPL